MNCHYFTQQLSKGFRGEYTLSQSSWKPCTKLRHVSHIGRRTYALQKVASRKISPKRTNLLSQDIIRRQLTYLGDPLKLSEYVYGLLEKDKFSIAEQLLRAASKNKRYTVGWNHLINYQLRNGKVNSAYQTYNEMKKRDQAPDAHTYTILFRGLAENSKYPMALTRALSIYHSMFADNSPVRPNTIHTNAVLKVCARVGDMDALFGIAGKLERKGLRAPNNLTFTTILNAIRRDALKNILDKAISTSDARKVITNARQMWDDIIARWRRGDIWVDEELVCSMGRTLLLGSRIDSDDILSLIEQTMQIPRVVPKLHTSEQEKIEPFLQAEANDTALSTTDVSSMEDLAPRDEFKPVRSLSGYAKPGRNTISLVLEALSNLRLRYPTTKYWDIFTKEYGIEPDSHNFHCYLRNMRLFRASTETVEILQQMPTPFLEMKTFRIAMSTCVRDKNNAKSFYNAEKILDLMVEKLPDSDVTVLRSYLDIAMASAILPNNILPERQHYESRYTPKGARVKQALDRLKPFFTNMKSILGDENRLLTMMDVDAANEFQISVIALARDMISTYDKLIHNGMVDKSLHSGLIGSRTRLAAFVTYSNHNRIGPKMEHASQIVQDGSINS